MPTLPPSFTHLTDAHEAEEIYFSSGAWGSTSARRALVSIAAAHDTFTGMDGKDKTDALALGSAVDAALCPCPHAKPLVVRPADIDGRTKEGKGWLAEHAGHQVITAAMGETIDRIRDRMAAPVQMMLEMAAERQQFQRVFRAVSPEGLPVQCRFDILRGDQPYDLKTTSTTLEAWPRSAWEYGYAFQAAWYSWVAGLCGRKLAPMRYLVVETRSPWRSCIYTPDSEWLAAGEAQRMQAVDLLTDAWRSDCWSDNGPLDRILSLPRWANQPGTTAGDIPAFGE